MCPCTQITLHIIPSTFTLHFYHFPHPEWQIAVWMGVIKHKCHSQITGSLIHCFNNKPAYPSIPTNPSCLASCLNPLRWKLASHHLSLAAAVRDGIVWGGIHDEASNEWHRGLIQCWSISSRSQRPHGLSDFTLFGSISIALLTVIICSSSNGTEGQRLRASAEASEIYAH